MIPSLPYILISSLALAMVLSMIFILRASRRSLSSLVDRLNALESEQLRINQAMIDMTANSTGEAAENLADRLQLLENNLERIEQTLQDQTTRSGEDVAINLEERLQTLESNQERIEQVIKDQTTRIGEETTAKNRQLKDDIKAFFTSSIESVLKKSAEKETEQKTQLDLLSAQVATLQQNYTRDSVPAAATEAATSAQPQAAPSVTQPPPLDQANTKARRLARLIVSEIALYNRKSLEEGIKNDTFNKLLEHDIKEAHALYARRVPEEIRNSTSYLEEAFTDLIAKTKRELNL
jgi:uncharacterized protein YukE